MVSERDIMYIRRRDEGLGGASGDSGPFRSVCFRVRAGLGGTIKEERQVGVRRGWMWDVSAALCGEFDKWSKCWARGQARRTWTQVLCFAAQDGSHFTLPSLESLLIGSGVTLQHRVNPSFALFLSRPALLTNGPLLVLGQHCLWLMTAWGLTLWIGHRNGRTPSASVPLIQPQVIISFRPSIPFLWPLKNVNAQTS